MEASSISSLEAWVDDTKNQINLTTRKFSEMEAMLGNVTPYCTSLLDLLQDIKDAENEYKSLQSRSSSLSNMPEMIGSLRFQMESLDIIYNLLSKAK